MKTLTSKTLRRPGIVHRLDSNTTGCIIIASNVRTVKYLSEQFKDREIDKLYLARVQGKFESFVKIEEDLGRDEDDFRRYKVVGKGEGKESITILKGLSYDLENDTSLIAVNILTGRTHQIRVIASHLGHPVVGDLKYGGKGERMELHCYEMKFEGEEGGEDEELSRSERDDSEERTRYNSSLRSSL